MKKVAWIIVVILLIVGFLYYRQLHKVPVDPTISHYSNTESGISFTYPKTLTASTTDGVVVLHHDIPYENHGDCDMKGDTNIYPRLTDFQVTMQVFNTDLVETMKTQSPYIPQENFINGKVIPSPGFIDTYHIGNFNGYAIYEGAEGCGQTTYYFPLGDSRTLMVTKASIQALSTARSADTRNQILAVPGVITPTESDTIFTHIMQGLTVQ